MNFLVHENLPQLPELLASQGDVEVFSGRQPLAHQLRQADVIFLRSITRVDESLLDLAAHVKLIGTGTIGTDHVDIEACKARGISFVSTPGANAVSVGEYVLAATLHVASKHSLTLEGKKALVVGAGHTGSQAGRRLEALGLEVYYIDPAPVIEDSTKTFVSWDFLEHADVISVHVPLVKSEPNPTYHLMAKAELERIKRNAILINASRGATIDNRALLAHLQSNPSAFHLVLDVWEGEPHVLEELVDFTEIATPHIAGHSLEGKLRASLQLYHSLRSYFPQQFLERSWQDIAPPVTSTDYQWSRIPELNGLKNIVSSVYNIELDDWHFRKEGLTASGFDALRQNYPIRRELSSLRIQAKKTIAAQVEALGFGVELGE